MKNYMFLAVGCLSLIIVATLAFCTVFFGNKPNTRWFIKDNIRAWANLNINDNRNYNVLEVGNQNSFFNTKTNLFVFKIFNNVIMRSDGIDVDMIRSNNDNIEDPNEYSMVWPKGSELIYAEGYSFIVNKGIVLQFYAEYFSSEINAESEAPIVGDINGKNMYKFPLSEQQLIEIFGEPDKVTDFYRH